MSFLTNNRRNGVGATNERLSRKQNYKRIPDTFQYRPGNHEDFTLIFNVLYHQLCYYSNKIVCDWNCAEDIVVDVFIKFWNQKGIFNNVGRIKRWLYKCTYNSSLNHLKRSQNRSTSDIESASSVADYDNILLEIVRREQFAEVFSLIDTLPAECRKIIRLYYCVGLDNAQIAAMFNISISTVKNQRARGIYLIKKRMSIYQN